MITFDKNFIMPDVIDLISSSPDVTSLVTRQKTPKVQPSKESRISIEILSDSDDAEVSMIPSPAFDNGPEEIFDYQHNSQTKRRRLSPITVFDIPPRPFPLARSDNQNKNEKGQSQEYLSNTLSNYSIPSPLRESGLAEQPDRNTTTRAKSKLPWESDGSDQIACVSPIFAPELITSPGANISLQRTNTIDLDLVDSSSDGQGEVEMDQSKSHVCDSTASLLARIDCQLSQSTPSSKGRKSNKMTAGSPKSKTRSAEEPKERPASSKSRKQKLTDEEKAARDSEKRAAKAQRKAEKEAEKERKRIQKEEKAKEKQRAADFAEVNKRMTNKKVTVREMIVDMASAFEGTSIGNHVLAFMQLLEVEMTFTPLVRPGIVTWRRKVRAKYNEHEGLWEPRPPTVEKEKHVLCVLSSENFVRMAAPSNDQIQTLDEHVADLNRSFPGCKIIYIIEGLHSYMRKQKNAQNRAYQAAVRRQMSTEDTVTAQQPRSRTRSAHQATPPPPAFDDDVIEDALLHLEVNHSCLIHHTATMLDTSEWIKIFTEHISTIPYRADRHLGGDNNDDDASANAAAFCLNVSHLRTGDGPTDTYVKMLQEIARVTAPIAEGVAATFPSVRELVGGFLRLGPLAVSDVAKGANRSGALTDARVGQAMSRRLYRVFTGLDPREMDV